MFHHREIVLDIEGRKSTRLSPDIYIVISGKQSEEDNEELNELNSVSNGVTVCSDSKLPVIIVKYDNSNKDVLKKTKLVSLK